MKKVLIIAGISTLLLAGVGYAFKDTLIRLYFRPTDSSIPGGKSSQDTAVTVVAQNLDIPWEVQTLPSGDFLVTERSGQLKIIGDNQAVIPVDGVEHVGEGGLLGLALDPQYFETKFIYLYMTTKTSNDTLVNRVERYRLEAGKLTDKTELLSDIPGAAYHDGGRIAFGPDGMLYITTGDAGEPDLAQDTNSLAGKILRMKSDGSVPEDNPFGNLVYSYGHRNPQGIAWDDQGRLWSTEHGPSGSQTGNDELNLITAGGNYGWPVIKGQQTQAGMIAPAIESGTDDTWAPGGMVFSDGSLYFAGLRGQAVYQAHIGQDDRIQLIAHYRNDFGRLRSIALGPDARLFMLTSNTDGRGTPAETDDRILSVPLSSFQSAQ